MKKSNERGKITRLHRTVQLNIGVIICVIILLYVIFHVFSYLTQDTISVYEVQQGSITLDDRYTAIAMRSETLVNADSDGYVYYFAKNGSRVGAKTTVYSLDKTGDITKLLTNSDMEAVDLDDADITALEQDISEFVTGYNGNEFPAVTTFKDDLSDQLTSLYAKASAEHASEIASAISAGTYTPYNAATPGFLLLSTDGYEGITADSLSPELFDSSDYKQTNLSSLSQVSAGAPVYRLVTSDIWSIAMPISDEMEQTLKDEDYIDVTFSADESDAWGKVSFQRNADQTYLILTFDDSMERYAKYRFLNVTLQLAETEGLKIPNSSIVKKKFFAVPKEYFFSAQDRASDSASASDTSDDSDVSYGILVQNDSGSVDYIRPTIYYETDDTYYIDNESVSGSDLLVKPDSQETYRVGSSVKSLKGVYNVNKGYAVFKRIEILSSNEDYSIVASGTDYGIRLYDHIVLSGDMVSENELIY